MKRHESTLSDSSTPAPRKRLAAKARGKKLPKQATHVRTKRKPAANRPWRGYDTELDAELWGSDEMEDSFEETYAFGTS
jgi:hypothetical protein